jgi:uncharacterized tellurite resistance protein B-like protein
MMWQVIYVDERVNEFESNIIWRTADLLECLLASASSFASKLQSTGPR